MPKVTTDPIRLRPDGSIDTAYYVGRGHRMRSEHAHQMVRGETPEKRTRRGGIFGILAL